MRKIVFVCIFVFLVNTYLPVYADGTTYPKITALEAKVFNRDFSDDDISNRLSRLETTLFGATYESDDLSTRSDRIEDNITRANANKYNNAEDSSELRSLAKLERKLFNRTFDKDDLQTRINRLEMNALGAIQSGSIPERIAQLKTATKGVYNSENPSAVMDDYFGDSDTDRYRTIGGGDMSSSFETSDSGLFDVLKELLGPLASRYLPGYSNYSPIINYTINRKNKYGTKVKIID